MTTDVIVDEEDYLVVLDPLNHYPGDYETMSTIIRACGILPTWLAVCFRKFQLNDTPIEEHMNKLYEFGIYKTTQGTTNDETGIYKFHSEEELKNWNHEDGPPDPPEYPYMFLRYRSCEAYIYRGAFLSWRESKQHEWYHTRMD